MQKLPLDLYPLFLTTADAARMRILKSELIDILCRGRREKLSIDGAITMFYLPCAVSRSSIRCFTWRNRLYHLHLLVHSCSNPQASLQSLYDIVDEIENVSGLKSRVNNRCSKEVIH